MKWSGGSWSVGRAAGALVVAVLVCAAPARAGTSWEYPLLPHVDGLAFFPDPLDDQHVTRVLLSWSKQGECWSVVSASVVDSAHVEVTLQPCAAIPESLYGWTEYLDLGVLHPGMHDLTVKAIVENGGPTVEQITVPFQVIHPSSGPPPPPFDTTVTMVQEITIVPATRLLGDYFAVHLAGRYPFDCGYIANAGGDSTQVSLTLESGACPDTNRVWWRDFPFGALSAGEHLIPLEVVAMMNGVEWHERHTIEINVIDPHLPPPPPPGDSLNTVLSPGHPNPFARESQFSVSLAVPQPSEVAVFDLAGRHVNTLFRGTLPIGTSQLRWNARDDAGRRVHGGIYFYRLVLPNRTVTRRVVLLDTP